jgi:hypothetical protein
MKEFALVYRNQYNNMLQVTKEQAAASMQQWVEWFNQMSNSGQLVSHGSRLEPSTGRVAKPGNVVTDGPYAEIKETIGGFSIIKAESYDKALQLAQACPIIKVGGNVEVREIIPMNTL